MLLGVTAALHVPFVLAAVFALDRAAIPYAVPTALLLAALLTAVLLGRLRHLLEEARVSTLRRLFVEEPYYVHWCAAVGSVPLLFLFWLGDLSRSLLTGSNAAPLGALSLAAYGTGLGLAFWGVVVRRRWVRVRTIDVVIPGLGEAFEGYRIAQLSDLHIGLQTPREVGYGWARKVSALDVDLVALTGDYVTSGVAFHADIAAVTGAMKARDGTYAVLGNHDYFGDGEPLVTLMKKAGVVVLRNEHAVIERGGGRLVLAGVDDTWTRRANVDKTLAGRDTTLPLLVLAHDPKLFPAFADRGAALTLSGHTHWGQVALPLFAERVNLARAAFPFHAGIYWRGASMLYVSPGMGTTGPPVRFGAPPEITVFRLTRKKAA